MSLEKTFPKSVRLLSSIDFRFRPFRRLESDHFRFVYNPVGKGRLGISVSKKVSKKAVARNRIKRLLREVYRKHREHFLRVDLHVIANQSLGSMWMSLTEVEVTKEFEVIARELKHGNCKQKGH